MKTEKLVQAERTLERIEFLVGRREELIVYLVSEMAEEDWHGVMDAAMDLRDLDAELRGLRCE